jgi:hypothetical protein
LFRRKVGSETLLGLEDDCERQDIVQEYYWFGGDAPVRLDVNPIWEAAKRAVPEDTTVWKGYDGRVDLPAGRFRVGLISKPAWRCCTQGTVDVDFSLIGGEVSVTKTTLNNEAEFPWGGCR